MVYMYVHVQIQKSVTACLPVACKAQLQLLSGILLNGVAMQIIPAQYS